MNKSELKSGENIVKIRYGYYYLVSKNNLIGYDSRIIDGLNRYYNDLTHFNSKDNLLDIMGVYSMENNFTFENLKRGEFLDLIWEREKD